VLLREALDYLEVHAGGTYIDATVGGGGYAEALLEQGARVFGFDTDPAAWEFSHRRLAIFGDRFTLVKENFSRMETSLLARGIEHGAIDGVVFDLGVSSHQLDTTSVGLSYRIDAPLDMRLDPRLPVSAREVVAAYDESKLARVFRDYGEEPYSKQIARHIARAREAQPIGTTMELAEAVTRGMREDKKNETLSRIFQALRIEVNHELENLKTALDASRSMLKEGGRLVVVSYHSLEDRIVKDFFKRESEPEFTPGSIGALRERIDRSRAGLRILTKKPVVPSAAELEQNPRARSAKLRAAERLAKR